MRYTPEVIKELKENEIFVFGSNEAGIHGAGAARLAMNKFGARYGTGIGLTGSCYAIPTKDNNIETLPLNKIQHYIHGFITAAILRPDLTFLVTKIGCGLAGYDVKDISPLFAIDNLPKNIILPKEFSQTK